MTVRWILPALLMAGLNVGARGATTFPCTVQVAAGKPAVATVLAAGLPVVRVRHATPAVAERLARVVAGRVRALAEQGVGPEAFSTRTTSAGVVVLGAGEPVATSTKEAAKLAGSTPAAQATAWVKALRQAFSLPYLTVPETVLLVPLGESLAVAVRGRPQGAPFKIDVAGEQLATAAPGSDYRGLKLTGRQEGAGTVTLRRGELALTLPLQVRRRAGRVTGPVSITVTGREVPAAFLREAVWSELLPVTQLEPGAQLRFTLPSRPVLPSPGTVGRMSVAVTIDGRDLLPYQTTLPVRVSCQAWPDRASDWLLVSNDPESVRATQLLLRGRLERERQTRLLYHHQNAAGTPLVFELRLLNPTAAVARVRVRDANAGPSPYPELCGHVAAKRYWEQRLDDQGFVLRLAPQTAWTITAVACRPQDVLSGLAELIPLDSDAVEVQMVATAGEPVRGPRAISGPTTAPYSEMFRFARPDQSGDYSYRPGGMFAFINIGRDPLKSLAGPPLMGNYGAVYDVNLEFQNTTDAPGRYELVFSADGGPALGTLVINDRIYETKLVRGAEQERLLELTLPPGGTRRYRVRILPESGSNYPLRLVGRPFTLGWAGRGRP